MAEAIEEVGGIISLDVESFPKDRRARFSLRHSIVLIVESLADIAVAILEKTLMKLLNLTGMQ